MNINDLKWKNYPIGYCAQCDVITLECPECKGTNCNCHSCDKCHDDQNHFNHHIIKIFNKLGFLETVLYDDYRNEMQKILGPEPPADNETTT